MLDVICNVVSSAVAASEVEVSGAIVDIDAIDDVSSLGCTIEANGCDEGTAGAFDCCDVSAGTDSTELVELMSSEDWAAIVTVVVL